MAAAGGMSTTELHAELELARSRVAELEASIAAAASDTDGAGGADDGVGATPTPMSVSEVARYGRQMILPAIGREGQEKLRAASVLIVGAGGLGCPTALYLAAGGVGQLTIVDDDAVELGNLHRQVLHVTAGVGQPKADSAARRIGEVNPEVCITPIRTRISPENAAAITHGHDVIVDCSDNMATRYLLNDVAVLLGLPLVAASALKCEGQLSTYDSRGGGPCYRCVFPRPLKPGAARSCSDSGVLGVVPGIMGCLEALEVFKLLVGPTLGTPLTGRLLLFDGPTTGFHTVRLGPRKPDCAVCGDSPAITNVAAIDYLAFCGATTCPTQTLLESTDRVTCTQFAAARHERGVVVVDVRPPVHYGIAKLPESINIPLATLLADDLVDTRLQESSRVIVICRRGNDSQIATQRLQERLGEGHSVMDLKVGDLATPFFVASVQPPSTHSLRGRVSFPRLPSFGLGGHRVGSQHGHRSTPRSPRIKGAFVSLLALDLWLRVTNRPPTPSSSSRRVGRWSRWPLLQRALLLRTTLRMSACQVCTARRNLSRSRLMPVLPLQPPLLGPHCVGPHCDLRCGWLSMDGGTCSRPWVTPPASQKFHWPSCPPPLHPHPASLWVVALGGAGLPVEAVGAHAAGTAPSPLLDQPRRQGLGCRVRSAR
eukprot:m.175304 g.175304  ORF g.175304 m.175304 type:complete len:656 (-) comp24403_c0_seq4:101-2068(-)